MPGKSDPQSATRLRFPVLIADIGGTNARFGLIVEPDAETEILGIVATEDFSGFEDAANHCLDTRNLAPESMVVAFAGPVRDGPMDLTNCAWTIDTARIFAATSVRRILIVNDFEALAMSLPFLSGDHLLPIGPTPLETAGNRLVLGPGTGLGVCGLVRSPHGWQARPAEAGHMSFGALDGLEAALWRHLDVKDSPVTAEHLLSGPGLVRLHNAIAGIQEEDCRLADPADVLAAARAGDVIAKQTLDRFCVLLGRFTRDMALMFWAEGGVCLAGGIVPRLADDLVAGGFRQAFEAGTVHADLLQQVPVHIITDPFPAFRGLAELARNPAQFDFDFNRRLKTATGSTA